MSVIPSILMRSSETGWLHYLSLEGKRDIEVPCLNEVKALREVADVAKVLLENHEEALGACAVCLSDGRGTHAEQLETALQKLEKARRG